MGEGITSFQDLRSLYSRVGREWTSERVGQAQRYPFLQKYCSLIFPLLGFIVKHVLGLALVFFVALICGVEYHCSRGPYPGNSQSTASSQRGCPIVQVRVQRLRLVRRAQTKSHFSVSSSQAVPTNPIVLQLPGTSPTSETSISSSIAAKSII